MVDEVQEKPQLLNGTSESHDSLNWDVLRARSIYPHGFGLERVEIWCVFITHASLNIV